MVDGLMRQCTYPRSLIECHQLFSSLAFNLFVVALCSIRLSVNCRWWDQKYIIPFNPPISPHHPAASPSLATSQLSIPQSFTFHITFIPLFPQLKTINATKMQFTNFLAVAVLLAGSALAAPAPDAFATKPTKPQPPTVNQQQNSCGNGGAPYCCNTDNKGKYTTCKVIGKTYLMTFF